MTERTPKCHVARGFKQRKIFISGSYLSFSRNVREFCAQKIKMGMGNIIVIIVSQPDSPRIGAMQQRSEVFFVLGGEGGALRFFFGR